MVLVYGTYGFLFLGGVVMLIILSIGRVTEGTLKGLDQMELHHFLLLLAGLLVFAIVFLSASIGLIIIAVGFAILVLVPLAAYLMIRGEITRRTWKKQEEEAEVAKFSGIIKKGADKTVGHIGLARVYERNKRFFEAAEEYRIVAEMFPDAESGYVERMREKEKLMRRMFEIEQRKKTFVCPLCQARNRPQQRRCSECGGAIHKNALAWMWRNTTMPMRIAAGVAVAVSVLYSIWLPVTYCLTMAAIWLTVIVYFSIPLEAVLSD